MIVAQRLKRAVKKAMARDYVTIAYLLLDEVMHLRIDQF